MDLGEVGLEWINMVHDKDPWWAFLNTAVNILDP
jgi:hypothetical protein